MDDNTEQDFQEPLPKREISHRRYRLGSFILKNIIELIIVFLGLVGALWLENYAQESDDREEYISDLRSLFGELCQNQVRLYERKGIIGDIEKHFDTNLLTLDFKTPMHSTVFLKKDPPPILSGVWLEVNRQVFENRDLLVNLRKNTEQIKTSNESLAKLYETSKELGELGFKIKFNADSSSTFQMQFNEDSKSVNSHYTRLAYLRTSYQSLVATTTELNLSAVATTNQCLLMIEKELEKFGIASSEIVPLNMKLSLANDHLRARNSKKAMQLGSDVLDELESSDSESKSEEIKENALCIVGQAYFQIALDCADPIEKEDNLLKARTYYEMINDNHLFLELALIEGNLDNQDRCLELLEKSIQVKAFVRDNVLNTLPTIILDSDQLAELLAKYNIADLRDQTQR